MDPHVAQMVRTSLEISYALTKSVVECGNASLMDELVL